MDTRDNRYMERRDMTEKKDLQRNDILKLYFETECAVRLDSSYPSKNMIPAEPYVEFTDADGNNVEIPNLKISVTLKNSKERLVFFTSATEIFHAFNRAVQDKA